MEETVEIIASLSTYTKRLLSEQIDRLNTEIEGIDPHAGHEERVAIARKHQQIADLQILVNEVPTLSDHG